MRSAICLHDQLIVLQRGIARRRNVHPIGSTSHKVQGGHPESARWIRFLIANGNDRTFYRYHRYAPTPNSDIYRGHSRKVKLRGGRHPIPIHRHRHGHFLLDTANASHYLHRPLHGHRHAFHQRLAIRARSPTVAHPISAHEGYNGTGFRTLYSKLHIL